MALSIDNQVQQRQGTTDGAASVAPFLDAGTTAGNMVIIVIVGGLSFPIPAGWATVTSGPTAGPAGAQSQVSILYRGPTEGLAGGETSWTFTQTTSTATSWLWWAAEYAGLADVPFTTNYAAGDVGTALIASSANWTSLVSPATGVNPWLDTLQLAYFLYRSPGRTAAQIRDNTMFVAYSDPDTARFDLIAQLFSGNASGPNWSLGVYRSFSNNTPGQGNLSFTGMMNLRGADEEVGSPASEAVVAAAMLTAKDSALLDPIVMCTGFEGGTHHGITAGLAGSRFADIAATTHGTSYLVQAGSAKTGSYGLRVVAAATVARVGWDTNSFGTGLTQAVCGFHVRPVSATTNPCVLAEVNAAAAGSLVQIVYNTTTSKVGVRFGSGGTVSYQSGTTTINSGYPWIDIAVSGYGGTSRTIEWQIEEGGVMVAQTAPANLTGQSATTWLSFTCGSATSQTMTADFDNVCLSNALADYPLKRHTVVLLGPDTAAGVDIVGTSWAQITSNAVGSAISAGTGQTALAALLDEVPPDFSATADGIAANAATAGNATVPLTSYTPTATERIDSVRMVIAMWKGASQASSVAISGRDSTGTATSFGTFAIGQSNTTTGSASTPVWICKNFPQSQGWTQTNLNALRFEISSADASPALGPLAVYAEVAICTDHVATPPTVETVQPLIRTPRPMEAHTVVGAYAPVNPSSFLGG